MPPSDSSVAGYGPGVRSSTRSGDWPSAPAGQRSSAPGAAPGGLRGGADPASAELPNSARTLAALDRAFGYPPRTDHDVRERAAVLECLRNGRPTGLPRDLDARVRAEVSWN